MSKWLLKFLLPLGEGLGEGGLDRFTILKWLIKEDSLLTLNLLNCFLKKL